MDIRNAQGQTLDEFLAAYDENIYRRPSATVDMVVFTLVENENKPHLAVLLISRRDHPCIGEWALPGGFLNMDEEVLDAVSRELYEETHISGLNHKFIGVFADVGRDPRTRIISLLHMAIAPQSSLDPKAGDDAASADLFVIQTGMSASGNPEVSLLSQSDPGLILKFTSNITLDAFADYSIHSEKGDIAFDHSAMLTKALIELSELPEAIIAAMLSPHSPERAVSALRDVVNPLKSTINNNMTKTR